MKCIYHSVDHDGRGSAAIIKRAFPECQMIGLDYGQTPNWMDFTRGELVYMVDFSLPAADMVRLQKDFNFVWIDHHFTAMMDVKKAGIDPKGVRDVTHSAIELTWNFIYPGEEVPEIVRYIGAHDRWVHTNPLTLPIFYGLQLQDTDPNNVGGWDTLFRNFGGILDDIAEDGKKIEQYVKGEYAFYAKEAAFEVEIDGIRFLAANRGLTGSKLLDSLFDPAKHDAVMVFYWQKHFWRFSMYTDKPDINLGTFAQKRGGGGHEKAAGFRHMSTNLPFPLPTSN